MTPRQQLSADEPMRWLDDQQQSAWRAYLAMTQAVMAATEAQLQRDAGIPHGYYEILVRLSEAPGRSMRMSALAAASLSSRSRLSHAVARLEERGWVARTDCSDDRRGQVATLTDEGYTALADAAPGHVRQVRAAVFDALSDSQVEALRTIGEAIARQATHLPRPGRAAEFVTEVSPVDGA